jgi:hypothetical protein
LIAGTLSFVMAGLVPAIHVFTAAKTWMAGTKPGHDAERSVRHANGFLLGSRVRVRPMYFVVQANCGRKTSGTSSGNLPSICKADCMATT